MVTITEANAREASAAAERLLHDRFLQEALGEMLQISMERAVYAPLREERRAGRFEAVAITNLQRNLIATADSWKQAADLLLRARAHE